MNQSTHNRNRNTYWQQEQKCSNFSKWNEKYQKNTMENSKDNAVLQA